MKNYKDDDFSGRRGAAADAKAALLNAHSAAKKAAKPTELARQNERLALAEARKARRAERERNKREEQERKDAQAAEAQAAADAATRTEIEAREAAERDRHSRLVEDAAARKAKRDERYAKRKARQR